MVYAHVYTEQEQESRIDVPLRITGLHGRLVLVDELPRTVTLSLRGKGKQILKLRMEQPEIIMDLGGSRPGEVQRMLSPTDVAVPVGTDVTVTEILEPKMLILSIDTLITREIPVTPVLVGELPEGAMFVESPRVHPSRVVVSGPASIVGEIGTLKTEPLSLDRLKENQEQEMPIVETDGIHLEPAQVTLFLSVARRETQVLASVPVRVSHLGPGFAARVEPDTAQVAVWGIRASLDSLDLEAVSLELNATDLAPGRHLLAPDLLLSQPLSVRLRWARPARFLVEIGRREP